MIQKSCEPSIICQINFIISYFKIMQSGNYE